MPPTHTPGLNFIYLLLALILCIGGGAASG